MEEIVKECKPVSAEDSVQTSPCNKNDRNDLIIQNSGLCLEGHPNIILGDS
jgi:hypothetical protein